MGGAKKPPEPEQGWAGGPTLVPAGGCGQGEEAAYFV